MRNLFLNIYDYFSPQWESYITKSVILEIVNPFFNSKREEEAVLVVQRSIGGRKRSFLIKRGRRDPVDIDFVRAFIEI